VNPSATPSACRDLEPLLAEQAAGALGPEDAARVEAHLADCASCRAEAAAYAEALGLARLPPLSDAERRAASDLPVRTLAALKRADRRRTAWKPFAAGVVAAAAAFAFLLAPAAFRRHVPAPQPVQEKVAWEAPDPDALWDDTVFLDEEDGSSSADNDTALAAFDAGHGR
jgi:anti-sigma factor RsiW